MHSSLSLGVYSPYPYICKNLEACAQSAAYIYIYTVESGCARLNPACATQWCYKKLP